MSVRTRSPDNVQEDSGRTFETKQLDSEEEEFWLGLLGEVDAHSQLVIDTSEPLAPPEDDASRVGCAVNYTNPVDDTIDQPVERDFVPGREPDYAPPPPPLLLSQPSQMSAADSSSHINHGVSLLQGDYHAATKDDFTTDHQQQQQQQYFDVDLNSSTREKGFADGDGYQISRGNHAHSYTAVQGAEAHHSQYESTLQRYQRRYRAVNAAGAAAGADVWGATDQDSNDEEVDFKDRLDFVFCQRTGSAESSNDIDHSAASKAVKSTTAATMTGGSELSQAAQYSSLYQYLLDAKAFTISSTAELTRVLYGLNQSNAQMSNEDAEAADPDPVDLIIEAAKHRDQSLLQNLIVDYVQPASAAALDWKDLLVARVALLVHSNVYLASLVGCVHESTLFMGDRLQAAAVFYLHKLQGDDPERIHMDQLRDAPDWQHLLLRCSMASLTWKQRQMLELTRDGGLLNSEELQEMMRKQVEAYDRARVMKVATEYFYFPSSATAGAAADAADTAAVTAADSLPGASSSSEEAEQSPRSGTSDIVSNIHSWLVMEADAGDEDAQYTLARFFTAPDFHEDPECSVCHSAFGITLFRHHCRFCGLSACDRHSRNRRCIFRYGMVQPVRVCDSCCEVIDETQRRDNLLWRNLRVESFLKQRLIPYFHPHVDRGIDKAIRIADYSLLVAKNTLAYNFPARVALDAVDVLRRYGLAGLTGLLLRKDFMESVEMLKKISGMDDMFSALSLHELTACVYYKLAIERGLRGCNPDAEHFEHRPRQATRASAPTSTSMSTEAVVLTGTKTTPISGIEDESKSGCIEQNTGNFAGESEFFECTSVSERDLELAIRLAPLALHFAYEENPVDCQRLAKLQGWDTVFTNVESELAPEQPCYVLFGASTSTTEATAAAARREVVLAIRGTQTVQDVVTDIRAAPVQFPPPSSEVNAALRGEQFNSPLFSQSGEKSSEQQQHWDWLNVPSHRTYACGGMLRAAMQVLREVGPAIVRLQREGYRITLVGHSLGGGVAALLAYLLKYGGFVEGAAPGAAAGVAPAVRCVTYGCPSCLDAGSSDLLRDVVLSVVLADDVISRITPQSIRLLMRELMVFREQMLKHLQQDWSDVMNRAANLWSPRMRLNPFGDRDVTADADTLRVEHDRFSGERKCDVSPREEDCDGLKADDIADDSATSGTVLVDEQSLKALWLPGRVLHLYRYRGQYRGAQVSRSFPGLRFIAIQSNIFEDHSSDNIMNALLETRTVLRLGQRQTGQGAPPKWVAFDASNACVCCSNSFTWNSTFRGEAQEFRDRNNCHFCGRLVCGPCSTQARAMPQLGFIFPRRICDQCLMKGDYAS